MVFYDTVIGFKENHDYKGNYNFVISYFLFFYYDFYITSGVYGPRYLFLIIWRC